MTTPNGVTIIAAGPGARAVDVTEGVQVLYDLVLHSMDWTSGFLTVEDVVPMLRLARACGFHRTEEIEDYMVERKAGSREMAEKVPYEPKHRVVSSFDSPEAREDGRRWMGVVAQRKRRARERLEEEGLL